MRNTNRSENRNDQRKLQQIRKCSKRETEKDRPRIIMVKNRVDKYKRELMSMQQLCFSIQLEIPQQYQSGLTLISMIYFFILITPPIFQSNNDRPFTMLVSQSVRSRRSNSSSCTSIEHNNTNADYSAYELQELNKKEHLEIQQRCSELYEIIKNCEKNQQENCLSNNYVSKSNTPPSNAQVDFQTVTKYIKLIKKKCKNYSANEQKLVQKMQDEVEQVKRTYAEYKSRKEEEIERILNDQRTRMLLLDKQHRKKINEYEDLVISLTQKLSEVQREWKKAIERTEQKTKRMHDWLHKVVRHESAQKMYYEEISELINMMGLRKEANDSLMSHQQSGLDMSPKRGTQQQTKGLNRGSSMGSGHQGSVVNRTIEISRIQPISQQNSQQDIQGQEIDNALRVLVSKGFFSNQNFENVRIMFLAASELAKGDTSYMDLMANPVYPILIEYLKNNAKKMQQPDLTLQQHIAEGEDTISLHSPLSNRDEVTDSIRSRHLQDGDF